MKTWVIAILALAMHAALPDKLSDFTNAVDYGRKANGEGCPTIPYSDLVTTCENQGRDLHDYCDGKRGPVTCGSEGITRQVKDNVDRQKKNVEALKEKKRSLEDAKSRATNDDDKNRISKDIEQVERDIYDGDKLVDQAIRALDERTKLVNDAIYNLEQCINRRTAVMNVFAEAQDKVRGETEQDIVPLARELRDMFEGSKRGHKIAIENKENALNTCKNSRP